MRDECRPRLERLCAAVHVAHHETVGVRRHFVLLQFGVRAETLIAVLAQADVQHQIVTIELFVVLEQLVAHWTLDKLQTRVFGGVHRLQMSRQTRTPAVSRFSSVGVEQNDVREKQQ